MFRSIGSLCHAVAAGRGDLERSRKARSDSVRIQPCLSRPFCSRARRRVFARDQGHGREYLFNVIGHTVGKLHRSRVHVWLFGGARSPLRPAYDHDHHFTKSHQIENHDTSGPLNLQVEWAQPPSLYFNRVQDIGWA